MTGSPEESFTLPVTFCWAKAVNEKLNRVSNKNKCLGQRIFLVGKLSFKRIA